MTALQAHQITQQANYPDNATSILEALFDAYNTAIKSDFEEIYRIMNGIPMMEIDEIIYTVRTLCRDHEKAGFIVDGTIGMSVVKELNTH